MKNISSVEHISFSQRLDFQAKSQSWKRRTKRLKMTCKLKSKANYINEKFNRWWFFENDKFCFCEMTFVIGINPTQHHVVERFLNVLLLLVSSEYSYSALHFSLGYTQKVFDKNPMQHQNEVVLNLLIMPPPSSWVQFCGLACRHQCSF